MKLNEYQALSSRTSPLKDHLLEDTVLSEPSQAAWRLANAAIGISSEASELMSLVLEDWRTKDICLGDLVIKELGDICWYAAEVGSALFVQLPEPSVQEKELLKVTLFIKINTCAGNISELLKKFLFHGKTLDREVLKSHLSDLLGFIDLLAKFYDKDLAFVLATNVDKLRRRYSEGFSAEASEKRVDLSL